MNDYKVYRLCDDRCFGVFSADEDLADIAFKSFIYSMGGAVEEYYYY